MCVLAFAWHAHPRWPIIMAGNRDELHSRPTSPLARWAAADHLLAGRDLQSGGTWLGVSELGRFAVVTNLRGYGAPQPDRSSRGALVTDALCNADALSDHHASDLLDYNPFNLIVADREQAQFLTNRPKPACHFLTPGVYGLSNGLLDEPWPKTVRLKEMLGSWFRLPDADPSTLLDDLCDEAVPDLGARSVDPSEMLEPPLSPIFIRNPIYGTRCSSVVAVNEHWQGVIIERRYNPEGKLAGETALPFAWQR